MGNGPNGSNGVDLRVGRYGATIRGRDTIVIVLLALALGAALYLMYKSNLDRKSEHEIMLRILEQQAGEMRIQTWIQSMPTDQRPRLVMPSGIEGRIIDRYRSRDDVDKGGGR